MSIQGAYLRVSHCNVLIAVFWLLQLCGADTSSSNVNYSVKPVEGSIGPCPDPCLTLPEIAALSTSDADQGLFGDASTNVTMTLLPGEHRLNTTLKISNGTRFALVGGGQSYSEYTIICSTGAKIDIDNVTEIFFDSFSLNSIGIYSNELIYVMHVKHVSVTSVLVSGQIVTLLFISTSSSVSIRSSVFTKVNASEATLLFLADSSLTFSDNVVSNNTLPFGYFAYLQDSEAILEGENVFSNNSGNCEYVLWYLIACRFSLKGDSSFIDNSIMVMSAYETNISFEGNTIISRNSVCLAPIWCSDDTTLDFNGSVIFSDNYVLHFGGAMILSQRAVMNIWDNSSLVFRNNSAGRQGGAIFVADIRTCDTAVKESCFMQFPKPTNNFTILFENNHAELGGEDIFGGFVLNCILENTDFSGSLFDVLSNDDYVTFVHDNGTLSSITSNPLEICLCEDNQISCCPTRAPNGIPLCSGYIGLGERYPGQSVYLSTVAVGQTHGTVPSEVRVLSSDRLINASLPVFAVEIGLENLKLIQSINATCTQIHYPIDSLHNDAFILYPGGACDLFNTLQVGVVINATCPPGFDLYETVMQCDCEARLKEHAESVQCFIDNQTFTHDNRVWIGYQESSGIVIHSSPCPFDYCREGQQVSFTLNNTDEQCSNHRTGILCGECKEGLSVLLGGTSQCEQCSNAYLGFILLFALAGLALIAIIFLLKMTVKYGTLSGLVFYANLVQVNRTLFLPEGQTNVLTIFVAWLNLDFGINTCFYDGLDAYGKTWLQFVFPFYIWIIIGGIILASHFSMRVTKALGSSPISVLATLILLSYVKIFQTCIAVISVTSLEYPTKTESVWKLDGNIKYLTGKHVPLFLFSLAVLILLFLPFTLLLLFGQWIQHITRWQTFSKTIRYVQRLSHFLDPYHAPYKPRHRYWPGLLLVVRVILTGISSDSDDPLAISSSIIAVIFLLQLWGWLSGGLYRKWSLDALEASFMLNLGLLTFANSNSRTNDQKTAIAYTSMSIAFLTFCGVVAYHVYHQIRKLYHQFNGNCLKKPKTAETSEFPSVQMLQPVSKTIVAMEDHQERSFSLREPLLDDNDS